MLRYPAGQPLPAAPLVGDPTTSSSTMIADHQIPGSKHPENVLGRPASQCWPEILACHPPAHRHAGFTADRPRGWEDIHLEVNRYGFVEETHFTIAYSPVPVRPCRTESEASSPRCMEITEKVVGERRILRTPRSGRSVRPCQDGGGSLFHCCGLARSSLKRHSFALLSVIDSDRQCARLAGVTGVTMGAGGQSADHITRRFGCIRLSLAARRGDANGNDSCRRRPARPSRP